MQNPSNPPDAVKPAGKADEWAEDRGNISFLVKEGDDFIVYIDKEGDIEWATTAKWGDSRQVGAIANRSAKLRALSLGHLSPDVQKSATLLRAEAIARALEKNAENANEQMKQAEDFISSKMRETARLWRLVSTACMAAAIALLAWPIAVGYAKLSGIGTPGPLWIAQGSSCGTLGALLSVIVRANDSPLDPTSGARIHFAEGISRAWVGAFCGVLIIAAIRARVLLPDVTDTYAIFLLAFVGGFSERLVPSIIERVGRSLLDVGSAPTVPEPPPSTLGHN